VVRSSIREPVALGDGLVLLSGRVVHVEAGRALLEDTSGAVWLELGPSVGGPAAGDVVEVRGRLVGAAVAVDRLVVLARTHDGFPRAGSDHAWLTAGSRRRLEHLRRRAAVLTALRATMDARGLLEVETPLVVPSPGLDLHLDAFEVAVAPPRFLITSPEYQMKRLLSAGLGDIYQLGKCFRRGEVGPRHQPEFTMLEWYRSPGSLDDVLADTEALVRAAAMAVGRSGFAGEHGEISLDGAFDRLSVAEAFRRFVGCDVFDVLPDEERFFRLVVDVIEPALGRERPVFLTRWPASMASLARLCPDDPRFAERAELFVDGMELCNAFGELTDPVEQRQRLVRDQDARRAAGLPIFPIDERFLAALADGIPPSGGNALGVDRLVMLACGTRDIEDVVAIPAKRL